MNVKLDENLPASLAEVLTAHGHEIDTVLAEDDGRCLGDQPARTRAGGSGAGSDGCGRVAEETSLLQCLP